MHIFSQRFLYVMMYSFFFYSTLHASFTEESVACETSWKKKAQPPRANPTTTYPTHPTPPYRYDHETPIMKVLKPITLDDTPSGLEGVDCIYLINLDRRPERLARIQTCLAMYGLHAQRLAAVDGQQLTYAVKKMLFGPYRIRMTNGAIGCLLSHLSILNDAHQRGFACIWILEDDVKFLDDPHILPSLVQRLQAHDPEWDILFTDRDSFNIHGQRYLPHASTFRPGQPERPLSYYHKKTPIGSDFFHIEQRLGTWSMFLSYSGIKKILDYYKHVYLWSPYDMDLYYTPNLHSYTTQKDIVTHLLERRTSDTMH